MKMPPPREYEDKGVYDPVPSMDANYGDATFWDRRYMEYPPPHTRAQTHSPHTHTLTLLPHCTMLVCDCSLSDVPVRVACSCACSLSSIEEQFDWYHEFERIKHIIERFIDPDWNVLHIGCGNSTLAANMYEHGYSQVSAPSHGFFKYCVVFMWWVTVGTTLRLRVRQIVNADISRVVIDQMQDMYEDVMPEVQWRQVRITRGDKCDTNDVKRRGADADVVCLFSSLSPSLPPSLPLSYETFTGEDELQRHESGL